MGYVCYRFFQPHSYDGSECGDATGPRTACRRAPESRTAAQRFPRVFQMAVNEQNVAMMKPPIRPKTMSSGPFARCQPSEPPSSLRMARLLNRLRIREKA